MLARQLQTLAESLVQFDDEIARRFATHEDAALFKSLPGSGAALAPRLLVAFGTDRTRFRQATDVQEYAGIAPVLQRSGNSAIVRWRWSAPTFVRQSFHEFATQSIRFSPWARAYYALQRSRGKGKHAAIRALAFNGSASSGAAGRTAHRTTKGAIPALYSATQLHSPVVSRVPWYNEPPNTLKEQTP